MRARLYRLGEVVLGEACLLLCDAPHAVCLRGRRHGAPFGYEREAALHLGFPPFDVGDARLPLCQVALTVGDGFLLEGDVLHLFADTLCHARFKRRLLKLLRLALQRRDACLVVLLTHEKSDATAHGRDGKP